MYEKERIIANDDNKILDECECPQREREREREKRERGDNVLYFNKQ